MKPPGRFLQQDVKTKLWNDVGDKKAREKASQCLRERNGAANEAVAALVKTVTANGEACPEDYETLMTKAAAVKAQNEVTIKQRQSEMAQAQNNSELNNRQRLIEMGMKQSIHNTSQSQQRANVQTGGTSGDPVPRTGRRIYPG